MRRFEVIIEDEGDWEEASSASSWDHDDAVAELGDYFWSERDGWEWMREGAYFLVRPVDDREDIKRVFLSVDFSPVFYGTVVAMEGSN